ncbi:MAG TPA: PRC-barrel domain-containing protein [Mycoplana sp.]|nr:PRC-barrel domain-containing protein [Mycoplana sp.]
MTRTLLTSVAAGAIFLGAAIAPVAYAQDTTQPSQTMETKPAMPDASVDPAKPLDSMDKAQTTTTAPATDMAAMEKTYLTEQSADQISANTYIGQTVYNAADESIGSINDLIMEKSGGITAAVIGVGGFLGIGEKWVAVPFDNISVNQTDNGEVKLTTTETAESLQAAPEFRTLAQQVDTTATSSTTTTTTTTPAPTTEPAPATEPAK